MVPEVVQNSVLWLLAEKIYTVKRVANIAGISEGTVRNIGKRGKVLRRRSREEDGGPVLTGEPCPSCGHVVPLPCVACATHRRRHVGREPEPCDISLFDLLPEDELRRQEVLVRGLNCLKAANPENYP